MHAQPPKASKYDLWITSSLQHQVSGRIELRFISVDTGIDIRDAFVMGNVKITPNGTTDLIVNGIIDHTEHPEPHVLAARLWVEEHIVSRDVDWPQPLKYLDFSDRGLDVERVDEQELAVNVKKPLKCLVFEERDGVVLDNNGLDVVPGDGQMVRVSGLGSEPLAFKFLGQ